MVIIFPVLLPETNEMTCDKVPGQKIEHTNGTDVTQPKSHFFHCVPYKGPEETCKLLGGVHSYSGDDAGQEDR